MLKLKWLNLQLFGEGGDGGSSAGGEGEGGNPGENMDVANDIPAHIPERARKMYEKAMAKTRPSSSQPTTQAEAEVQPTEHVAYTDLIKSDEYKEEHKAYMDKAIGDRLKKYKGLEESSKKMSDALSIVATKYGLDVTADNFLDTLSQKISEDTSYYEDYAMEHDISTKEAKEILDLRREVAQNKAIKAEAERQQRMNEQLTLLRQSAERTKAVYPSFDLDVEMQNERFRTLCAATQGDTLAAYRAVHHDEIMRAQGMAASRAAQQQMANTVAANKSRPLENGLSSQASAVVQTDWSKASLADIRKYADEQRRLKSRS